MTNHKRTCRFCKEAAFGTLRDTGFVKYGTRHQAHTACFLDHKGAEGFYALTPWQQEQFPYRLLRDRGLAPRDVAPRIRVEAV